MTLSSASPSVASVPSSIVVAAGNLTADFAVRTYPVTTDTGVLLTAVAGGVKDTATLTVQAPTVTSLSFVANPVTGGNAAMGTVTLNGPVTSAGATVTLSSVPAGVVTFSPTTVTIPGGHDGGTGATSATFTVNTSAVSSSTRVVITATHTTNCDGAVTANLTVNPTNFACYISNLTLSPPAITGVGTTVGTVTLSAAAPVGGVVVNLHADTTVTVPPTVTVLAGSQTATFTVTSPGVSALTYATISGSYNTWKQGARLVLLPQGYNLSVQNLMAWAGNGCVFIRGLSLPDFSVQGYNFYRLVGGMPVLRNTTPVPSPEYADTNLSNGTAYSYQVTSVDMSGHESAPTTCTATPNQAAPLASWADPPMTAITGSVDLYATETAGFVSELNLVIDGKVSGSAQVDVPPLNFTPPGPIHTSLDTTQLSNGVHSIQLIGYNEDGTAFVTPVLTIQTSNNFSSLAADEILQTSQDDLILLQTSAPAGTVRSTVQILDTLGNVVNSWQTSSGAIQLAWDGKDAAGNFVNAGGYTFQFTAYDASGNQATTTHPAWSANDPFAIALVAYSEAFAKNADIMVSNHVAEVYAYLGYFTYSGNGDPSDLLTSHDAGLLKTWLQSSAQVLYWYYHGSVHSTGGAMYKTQYRGLTLWPTYATWSEEEFGGTPIPFWAKTVFNVVATDCANSQYQFVWLDCCHSAGGGPATPQDPDGWAITAPDYTWASAFSSPGFNVFQTVFLGWDGSIPINEHVGGTLDDTFYWRINLWNVLGTKSKNYFDSLTWATMATQAQGANQDVHNPWDGYPPQGPWRAVLTGALWETLP